MEPSGLHEVQTESWESQVLWEKSYTEKNTHEICKETLSSV